MTTLGIVRLKKLDLNKATLCVEMVTCLTLIFHDGREMTVSISVFASTGIRVDSPVPDKGMNQGQIQQVRLAERLSNM